MMMAMDAGADLSSLRISVLAGETLPGPVFDEWMKVSMLTLPWQKNSKFM